MHDSFDAFEYLDWMGRQWRVMAVAIGVAAVLSLGLSLMVTKRYTATASIVIEPPGAADPRNTTAVSQIYLESLKTYERFASSDSLFARAATKFRLIPPGGSVESLKRRVLKVAKIRDTKILEISATLPDPRLAQSLAQYVAEETASLNKTSSLAGDRELADEAEKQTAEAQLRLEQAQKAFNLAAVNGPVEALRGEIDASIELQSRLRQQLVEAEANVAEYQQQTEGQFAKEQLGSAKARAALLEKRTGELEKAIQDKSMLLATRVAKRDELQTELKIAQSSYETNVARLRDLRAGAGTHSERLRVIDPGIVPQRPSSPNVVLNVGVAMFLALAAAALGLSLAFAYRKRPVSFEAELARSRHR